MLYLLIIMMYYCKNIIWQSLFTDKNQQSRWKIYYMIKAIEWLNTNDYFLRQRRYGMDKICICIIIIIVTLRHVARTKLCKLCGTVTEKFNTFFWCVCKIIIMLFLSTSKNNPTSCIPHSFSGNQNKAVRNLHLSLVVTV